ncbi:hypothetical protein PBI_PHANTASTIC_89 [Mycobacterium phage Phantastic]|uniref:Glycosylase n=1 Tax=Mycobacterium phage Phantastic TaxID=1486426 RepID=A0A023W7J8_9CAUD|nr:hypothetical protein FH39_gp10 [Mycobacterium phage Phantastic]AHY27152.1 hypothetical protein PBI_PHANTASTIC_89 [Mycobacterium phage Phantastic]
MASHNEVLGRIDLSTRKVTDNIIRVFAKASEQDILDGKVWYEEAKALAVECAVNGGMTLEQSAVMIAQLSPRLRWNKNVEAARSLVATGKAPGVLSRSVERALQAMTAEDPWSTFGKAPKTRSFALNILGDDHAVTVDVWAARVAGITEQQLGRAGVYEAIAHCYRLAAKRVGISPAQMQAITWVVARGRA